MLVQYIPLYLRLLEDDDILTKRVGGFTFMFSL